MKKTEPIIIDLNDQENFRKAYEWCLSNSGKFPADIETTNDRFEDGDVWTIFGVHTGQFDWGRTSFYFISSSMATQFKLIGF